MRLPRLFVNGAFTRLVNPISLSITQNIVPLDTASITLPIGEELPARSWVELFTPYGSAGMFRVRSPHDAYGQDISTAELEHMISEVGDYIVKEEIAEMLPASSAMQRVFSHYGGNLWQLGSVSALGSGLIACEAKYERVLDTMLAILEQKKDCMMSFDFTTSPWTVNIVKKGTVVSAEGRLARNVSSAVITLDDSELATRIWYQTFNSKKEGTWVYKDAPTRSKYGIVEKPVRTSSDMTADEINATVDAFIEDHKEPRASININGSELSQITGESMDQMLIGKLYRLALPDYGITVEDNITSIVWSDVYGNPTAMTVNLGAEEDTVVTFLHNLDAKGTGGGGGGRAKDKEEEAWKEYYTEWDKQDEYIAGMAAHVDTQGKILEQAGLTLNSEGLLVYANTSNGLHHQFDILNNSFTSKITNATNNLQSEINQLEGQIQLKVSKGNVISEINLEPGTAKIRADKIILDGQAIAQSLVGEYIGGVDIGCGTLTVEGFSEFYKTVEIGQGIAFDSGATMRIDDGKITVGSHAASWKSKTITTYNLSNLHHWLWDNDGETGWTSGSIIVGHTDSTIYYLGR